MRQNPWSIASLAGPRFGLIVTLTCVSGLLMALYVAMSLGDPRVPNIVLAAGWGFITIYHAVLLVRALRYRSRDGGRARADAREPLDTHRDGASRGSANGRDQRLW